MHLHWLVVVVLSVVVYARPEVQLGDTTLTGRVIADPPGVEFFGGIPFAHPPLGDLRLAPAVYLPTPGVPSLNATRFGAECIQSSNGPGQSEDCLTVNVFRPANLAANASLPVMVWIYGGGFTSGASNIYDASDLVAHSVARGTPIIFASLNYRVGPLGFPMGNEAAGRDATNLGLKDALTALQWVHDNIHAFGGDSTKVTAFGESAGSITLSLLFLNPGIDRIIRAGIMQSGSPTSIPIVKASAKEADWQFFVSLVPSCASAQHGSTFECLHAASTAELAQATVNTYAKTSDPGLFFPAIDGPGGVFPDTPIRLYEQGHFARLPFIQGDNLDEATFFLPTTINSSAEMRDYIVHNLSLTAYPQAYQDDVAVKLMKLYPDNPALGSPYGTGSNTFGHSRQWKREASLMGDLLFQAPRRLFTKTLADAGVPAWGYLLTDPQPQADPDSGVSHAADLPYFYPKMVFPPWLPPRPQKQAELGAIMMDYWISFATSLDPNDRHGNTSRPVWPGYDLADKKILGLNSAGSAVTTDTFRQASIDYLIELELALERNPVVMGS